MTMQNLLISFVLCSLASGCGPTLAETVYKKSNPGTAAVPADLTKPPKTAQTTPSGLSSLLLESGHGTVHPRLVDTVEVHYTGWTTGGKMFDSSLKRQKTAKFPLERVIAGWREGVQLMVEGETRRFWIPPDLAYGEKSNRPGVPTGMLVFDVHLYKIFPRPDPPQTPADVSGPPAEALVTKSGLASKVLKRGTGTTHPGPADRVTVHYTGWTTSGKMFDSSVLRNQTATFPLNAVIKGWQEGVQLMVVGEKRRFWIPPELAYGNEPGRPGAPTGMLVFDVELRDIAPAQQAP